MNMEYISILCSFLLFIGLILLERRIKKLEEIISLEKEFNDIYEELEKLHDKLEKPMTLEDYKIQFEKERKK